MGQKKTLFKKVTIIGVGEIGSSIAMALKKRRLVKEVIGIGRKETATLKKVKKSGIVDRIAFIEDMANGVKDADLIVVATPVGTIVEFCKKAAACAKDGAMVTDVGSTKKVIVEQLEDAMPANISFVGSHPMAGSEKGGPENSRDDLFEGRDCFITETPKTDKDSLKKIKNFWKSVGIKNVVIMTPHQHDRIVAGISHMIHIVASALVLSNKDNLGYAASGFRDTTRLALADPGLWRDICVTNDAEIEKSLGHIIAVLEEFKQAVTQRDTVKIESLLCEAREHRQKLNP
jgi:cyclohexadieny/prephenate dehydrogenase